MIRSSHSAVRGFTLIELMVVIVIMGIMASLVLLNTSGAKKKYIDFQQDNKPYLAILFRDIAFSVFLL